MTEDEDHTPADTTAPPDMTPFDEDDMRAAELVMGLLDEDDALAATRRARQDVQFGTAVALWQERLVAIADDVAPVKPPRRLKGKITQQVFAKTKVSLGKRVWVWQTLTYTSLAVAMYLAVQSYATPPAGPSFATQLASADTDVQMIALYEPGKGTVSLNLRAGAAAGPDRDLELWVIAPNAIPVSLGILPGDQPLFRVEIPAEFAAQAGRLTFALTDEPLGGSPSGAPTGPVVASGVMAQI